MQRQGQEILAIEIERCLAGNEIIVSMSRCGGRRAPKPDPAAYTEVLKGGLHRDQGGRSERDGHWRRAHLSCELRRPGHQPGELLAGDVRRWRRGLLRRAVVPPVPLLAAVFPGPPLGQSLGYQSDGSDASGDGCQRRRRQADLGHRVRRTHLVVDEPTQTAFISHFLNSWSQIDFAGPSFIYTT